MQKVEEHWSNLLTEDLQRIICTFVGLTLHGLYSNLYDPGQRKRKRRPNERRLRISSDYDFGRRILLLAKKPFCCRPSVWFHFDDRRNHDEQINSMRTEVLGFEDHILCAQRRFSRSESCFDGSVSRAFFFFYFCGTHFKKWLSLFFARVSFFPTHGI